MREEYGERSTFESHTYLKIYLVMLKGLDAVLNNKKKKRKKKKKKKKGKKKKKTLRLS